MVLNIKIKILFCRKYCKKCRYKKCLDAGMKPELVDASLRNREADIKSVKDEDRNREAVIQPVNGKYANITKI